MGLRPLHPCIATICYHSWKVCTRIHPKYVHKNSPQKRNCHGQFCPPQFIKSVHENSPSGTDIPMLFPLIFETWKTTGYTQKTLSSGLVLDRKIIIRCYLEDHVFRELCKLRRTDCISYSSCARHNKAHFYLCALLRRVAETQNSVLSFLFRSSRSKVVIKAKLF